MFAAVTVFCGLSAIGDDLVPPSPLPSWIAFPDKPLSITSTEITVAQFGACIDAGVCQSEHFDPACNTAHENRIDHPMNCVDFRGAEQYCRFAGGRLCSEDEWLDACRGSEGRAYPYGGAFEIEACNMQSLNNAIEERDLSTDPVASNSGCQGGLAGLHDMAGNVNEWVDTCKDEYCKFRGGAFLTNDPVDHFAACGGVCAGNQKSFRSGTIGVRCCRDETP